MSAATGQSKPMLEQRRAKHAWKAVEQIVADHVKKQGPKRLPDDQAKKYGRHAKRLPARIHAAGLGQALAFLYAKQEAPELLQRLGDWVLDKRHNPFSEKPPPVEKALIEAIVVGEADFLRRATEESMAWLLWLNRFADAEGLTEGED
jgi:CRISPR-associated protein Cmr5